MHNNEAVIPQAGKDRADVFPQEAAEPAAHPRAVDRSEPVVIGEGDGFSGGPFDEPERRGLRPCFLRGKCHEPELMPVIGMVSRSAELRSEENG